MSSFTIMEGAEPFFFMAMMWVFLYRMAIYEQHLRGRVMTVCSRHEISILKYHILTQRDRSQG
jgi:hypothetical protein